MTLKVDIVPDAQYDPTFQPVITGRTRLAQSITMSKFLGTYNDPQSISHLTNKDKLLLAKQYYLHAQVLQLIRHRLLLLNVSQQIEQSLIMNLYT